MNPSKPLKRDVPVCVLCRTAYTHRFVWIAKNTHFRKSHLLTSAAFFTKWEQEGCLHLVKSTLILHLVQTPNQTKPSPLLTKGGARNALQL